MLVHFELICIETSQKSKKKFSSSRSHLALLKELLSRLLLGIHLLFFIQTHSPSRPFQAYQAPVTIKSKPLSDEFSDESGENYSNNINGGGGGGFNNNR